MRQSSGWARTLTSNPGDCSDHHDFDEDDHHALPIMLSSNSGRSALIILMITSMMTLNISYCKCVDDGNQRQ